MLTLAEAKEKAARLEARFKRMREEGLTVVKRGTKIVMAGAGGATSALAQVYFPTIPGTQFPSDLAIGLLAAGAGTFDLLGGAADELVGYSCGVLGAVVARELKPALESRKAA